MLILIIAGSALAGAILVLAVLFWQMFGGLAQNKVIEMRAHHVDPKLNPFWKEWKFWVCGFLMLLILWLMFWPALILLLCSLIAYPFRKLVMKPRKWDKPAM